MAELKSSVLEEENTAQSIFDAKLNGKPISITEITFLENEPLSGSLNLGILTKNKYNRVQKIIFAKGKITSLVNIPESIKVLVVANNLLTELDHLPNELVKLDVANNNIDKLKLTDCEHLKELNISHNKISELDFLPDSLIELYADHNLIKTLNLVNNSKLHTLHCENNPNLEIFHIPDSLVNTKFPTDVVIHSSIDRIMDIKHIEKERKYKEALNGYFLIKKEYEKKMKAYQKKKHSLSIQVINDIDEDFNKIIKKNRETSVFAPYFVEEKFQIKPKKKRQINPPKCKGCGSTRGMVFQSKNDKYEAFCGNSPPCDWKIIIHRGFHQNNDDVLFSFKEEIDQYKENIMKDKMDTLFKYIEEKKSIELFEKNIEAYNQSNDLYQKFLNDRNEMHFNESKQKIINDKKKEIQEDLQRVQQELREGNIELAVKIQIEDIKPKMANIHFLQYEYEKMIDVRLKDVPLEELRTVKKNFRLPEDPTHHYLLQEEVILSKMDVNLGEEPSIEHFQKK